MGRAAAFGLVVAVTSLLGCGGQDPLPSPVVVPPDPYAEPAPTAVGVRGHFAVPAVVGAYGRFGIRLRVEDRVEDRYASLGQAPGPSFAPGAPYLGIYTVFVTGDSREASRLLHSDAYGILVLDRERGVIFRSHGGALTALARFGNVVVTWVGGHEARTDARWRRLVAPLESLGGEARLPERSCASSGIDPEGTLEGTCRLGPQSITFANRDSSLGFDDLSVAVSGTEVRKVLEHERRDLSVGPDLPQPPQPVRAHGLFLIVRLEAKAGAERAVPEPPDGLVVGGRYYSRSEAPSYYVDETLPPWPLQPGRQESFVALFDLPGPIARRALEDGSYVISDPRSTSVEGAAGAARVGRIRLR